MNKLLMVLGVMLLLVGGIVAGYSIAIDRTAGENSQAVLDELSTDRGTDDYKTNPDIPMPTKSVKSKDYVGEISIPSIDITLPVLSEYRYRDLDIAPCRYDGSAYTNDMIIAGHSYLTHFRKIRSLTPGEEVIFTDTENHKFTYTVSEKVYMSGDDVEQMLSGEWDLTLFTCTATHVQRCAIRCTINDK